MEWAMAFNMTTAFDFDLRCASSFSARFKDGWVCPLRLAGGFPTS